MPAPHTDQKSKGKGQAILLVFALSIAVAACQRQEETAAPMLTPTVTLSRASAPIGSPVDVTYRFAVAPGVSFNENYRVFVHFLDVDRELMWTDDHDPPVPTTQWKAGETVEYTRTMFIPKFPYVGETMVQVGLHSPSGERIPMNAPTRGLREYDLATFNLTTQGDNLVVVFKDGWHRTEVTGEGVGTEWQWSRQQGVLAFRNPMSDAILFLQLDQPLTGVEPQHVEVRIGEAVVDSFDLAAGERQLRRIAIRRDQMGSTDAVDVVLAVARTFVPADIPAAQSQDQRDLGVRVFRAYLEPR